MGGGRGRRELWVKVRWAQLWAQAGCGGHPQAHLPDDGGGKGGEARVGAGAVAPRRAQQRAQALAHHVLRSGGRGREGGWV